MMEPEVSFLRFLATKMSLKTHLVGSIALVDHTGLSPPTGLECEALDGAEEHIGNRIILMH